MKNLYTDNTPKDFFVWISPKDIYANHNANIVGSFVSVSNTDDNLMFLPNKEFSGYISPFQSNLLRSYQAEYDLEITRKKDFFNYPSRLAATFLFETEEDAETYRKSHGLHVKDRQLKKGKTVGEYTYSKHDLAWIDFLRTPLVYETEIRKKIVYSYWKGESVKEFKMELLNYPLYAVADPIYEVLFIGRIDFVKN